jgi:hypothetical protein
MPPEAPALECRVCGDPVGDRGFALCHNCDLPFHLRDREDQPGEDCGEFWVNDQYLALEFACFVCLGKRPGSGSLEPPVASGH